MVMRCNPGPLRPPSVEWSRIGGAPFASAHAAPRAGHARLTPHRESAFSPWMAYRRTENVIRRQAERHDAIVAAAAKAASEGGMAAIQIAPVAARAGIAAGTVYRYFPGKTDLVGALIESIAEKEIAALR